MIRTLLGMLLSWLSHFLIASTIYMGIHIATWFVISLLFPLPIPVLMAATISAAATYDGREFGAIGDNAIDRILGGGIKNLFRKPVFSFGGSKGQPLMGLDNFGDYLVPKFGILIVYGWLLGMIW